MNVKEFTNALKQDDFNSVLTAIHKAYYHLDEDVIENAIYNFIEAEYKHSSQLDLVHTYYNPKESSEAILAYSANDDDRRYVIDNAYVVKIHTPKLDAVLELIKESSPVDIALAITARHCQSYFNELPLDYIQNSMSLDDVKVITSLHDKSYKPEIDEANINVFSYILKEIEHSSLIDKEEASIRAFLAYTVFAAGADFEESTQTVADNLGLRVERLERIAADYVYKHTEFTDLENELVYDPASYDIVDIAVNNKESFTEQMIKRHLIESRGKKDEDDDYGLWDDEPDFKALKMPKI